MPKRFGIWHALGVVSLLTASLAIQAAPILSISGPATLQQGQSGVVYSVDVADSVSGALDISSADIVLGFDPSVFAYDSATPGNLLSPPSDFFSAGASGANVTIGIIMDIFAPITGPGSLAELTFHVPSSAPLGAAAFVIRLNDTELVDSNLNPISYTATPLTVQVIGTTPIPAAWMLLVTGLFLMRRVRTVSSPESGPQWTLKTG